MEITSKPISDNHKSAMFFHGVLAINGDYSLRTFQDGELMFMGNEHIDSEIIELGQKGLIDDNDIEEELTVDILVNKFICIYYKGNLIDEGRYYFDNYDDALQGFEDFLNEL